MPSTQPAPAITMIAFDIPKSTSQSVRSDSSAGASFSTTMKESAGRAAVKARDHAARSASRRSALRVGHGAELASAASRRRPATLEIIGDRSAHRLNGQVLLRFDVAADADRHRSRRPPCAPVLLRCSVAVDADRCWSRHAVDVNRYRPRNQRGTVGCVEVHSPSPERKRPRC